MLPNRAQLNAYKELDLPESLLDMPVFKLRGAGRLHNAAHCTMWEAYTGTAEVFSIRQLEVADVHGSCFVTGARDLLGYKEPSLAGTVWLAAAFTKMVPAKTGTGLTPGRMASLLGDTRVLLNRLDVAASDSEAEAVVEGVRDTLSDAYTALAADAQTPSAREHATRRVRGTDTTPMLVHVSDRFGAKLQELVTAFFVSDALGGWLLLVPANVEAHLRRHFRDVVRSSVVRPDAEMEAAMLALWEPEGDGPLGGLDGALATARAI